MGQKTVIFLAKITDSGLGGLVGCDASPLPPAGPAATEEVPASPTDAELIEASTLSAAEAIGWEDRIGTLGVGREADVAVLSLDDVDVDLEDCQGQMRRIQQRLSATAVWRAGVPGQITHPLKWPNPEKLEDLRSFIPMLKISDEG